MKYATVSLYVGLRATLVSLCTIWACTRNPTTTEQAIEARAPNPAQRPRGNMTRPAGDVGMPNSPAFLAAGDTQVLVADRGGSVLWWDWPKRKGPLVKAHDDGGPVAGTSWFATSGGWDPTVKRWEFAAEQPRFTVRPFDGRVTALCIQGDILLVAGMNKAPVQGDAKQKDQVALSAGTVVRVDPQGKVTPFPLKAVGQIDYLLCGSGWVLAVDRGAPSTLHVVSGDKQSQIPLQQGPATAATSRGSDAVVANRQGLWVVDPAKSTVVQLARLEESSPRVLSLLALGDHVFGSTSEGVIRWPGGERITHGGKQPAALVRLGQSLLILWEDGALEQRTPDGKLTHGEAVPRS